MSFQATGFEFRNRFWFIAGIYSVAFWCYSLDKTNVAVALTQRILTAANHNSPISMDSPVFDGTARLIFAGGTLVLILAALIRSWATAYLKSGIVHDAAVHSESLVADGPYRHVRNPLYLGNILQALGIGLMASRLGFAILFFGNLVFLIRLIRYEEAGLLVSQGESYRRYFEAVPRLWPSLVARVPSGGGRPNWPDGFLGEMFFWIFAAGMAVFTVTLHSNHFLIALAVGFAVYFLQSYLRSRSAA
jgi:protein-S-isoprenylcysteine O-methyltransferase Ste14